MLEGRAVAGQAFGPWVEQWLSRPRFDRYLGECGGDRDRAFATYEWNALLSQAVARDIAHFEVALRNAYDRAMTARWRGGTHWLLDPASPVLAPLGRRPHGKPVDINLKNRASVAEAVARTGGANATPDAVVAELSFGFWRHMADAGHEKAVWVPYLHHAWPPRTSRAWVDGRTRSINEARNRSSHHEPLFGTVFGGAGIAQVQADLVSLLGMLSPALAAYVQATSTVGAVLAQKP
jgi:hypothetical protein